MEYENGDKCPKCKKKGLPKWKSENELARKCQECGYVEEREVIIIRSPNGDLLLYQNKNS